MKKFSRWRRQSITASRIVEKLFVSENFALGIDTKNNNYNDTKHKSFFCGGDVKGKNSRRLTLRRSQEIFRRVERR